MSDLDEAWAEAEAALPEGAWLTVVGNDRLGYNVAAIGYPPAMSMMTELAKAPAGPLAPALRVIATALRTNTEEPTIAAHVWYGVHHGVANGGNIPPPPAEMLDEGRLVRAVHAERCIDPTKHPQYHDTGSEDDHREAERIVRLLRAASTEEST